MSFKYATGWSSRSSARGTSEGDHGRLNGASSQPQKREIIKPAKALYNSD